MTLIAKIDRQLQQQFKNISVSQNSYWEFKKTAARTELHGCARYPAMMVPQLQFEILKTLVDFAPDIKSVYEPFVGSGTAMSESMKFGLDFTGYDINPLAVLLCKAKRGPFKVHELRDKSEKLESFIKTDKKFTLET